jgi:branched-chain amino acid transport system ATP-binding protein
MLEVDDLHAYYGKSHILQGISFRVGEGEIVSLLGRNGAGRTTAIKTIMGHVPAVGSIRFKGERIDQLKTHEIARRGLGYVPEDRAIFPTLTVRENLTLGMKPAAAPDDGRRMTCSRSFRCCANASMPRRRAFRR